MTKYSEVRFSLSWKKISCVDFTLFQEINAVKNILLEKVTKAAKVADSPARFGHFGTKGSILSLLRKCDLKSFESPPQILQSKSLMVLNGQFETTAHKGAKQQ